MIHNKYFEILKQFSGNYNKAIYGRQLINKVHISQKNIANILQTLENENILKSTRKGNIKFYSLNLKNNQIKSYIAITEFFNKIQFCLKHNKINHIFNQDDRIIGVFGSYAKGMHKENSDLDIFIIGNKKNEDYSKKGELFDIDVSIKYFTEKEFKELLNKKNNLIKEIIENHILLFNIEKFIELAWEEYYDFN